MQRRATLALAIPLLATSALALTTPAEAATTRAAVTPRVQLDNGKVTDRGAAARLSFKLACTKGEWFTVTGFINQPHSYPVKDTAANGGNTFTCTGRLKTYSYKVYVDRSAYAPGDVYAPLTRGCDYDTYFSFKSLNAPWLLEVSTELPHGGDARPVVCLT